MRGGPSLFSKAMKKPAVTTTTSSKPTKVLPCACKSEFHDSQYGKGLHNRAKGKSGKGSYRCTVCDNEKE